MTLLSSAELDKSSPNYGYSPTIAKEVESDIPMSQTLGAAFELGNTIGSYASSDGVGWRANTNYDSFNNIDGYEEFAEAFVQADSDEDVATIKKDIDRQKENRRVLDESGVVGGVSLLAAGLVDPVSFIPVGGAAYKSYRMGGSILKGAMHVGKAGLVSSAVQESVLQPTQSIRTLEEGAINVGASTLLSGVLGGTVAGVKHAVVGRFAKDMEIPPPNKPDILTEPNSIFISNDDLMRDTVGAARVPQTTLADETLKGAFKLEKGTKFLSPNLRLANSVSLESRKLAQRLTETPYFYEKNDMGIASPIASETLIKMDKSLQYKAEKVLNKQYAAYRNRVKAEGGERLTKDGFAERAGNAMRNNDTDEIPEISVTAKAYRTEVFDPLKSRAIETGLLDKDVSVSTSDTYFMRSYNKNKIVANMVEWKEKLVDGLKQEAPDITNKLGKYYESKINRIEKQMDELSPGSPKAKALKAEIDRLLIEFDNQKLVITSDADMRQIADEVTNHILGLPEGATSYQPIPVTRGPLKERVLNFVKDEDIKSFLHSDIRQVSNGYTRTMSPDITLTKEFGSTTLKPEMDAVISEYTAKIEAAKTEKDALALNARMRRDLHDIESLVALLRNQYGMPKHPDSWFVRGGRMMRQANFIRMLGGMTQSAIPDIYRPIVRTGILNAVRHGLVPMIKNFKQYRIEAEESRMMSGALELVMSGRFSVMADIDNIYVPGTKIEKGLGALSNKFGNLVLMNQWNTVFKGFSGVLTQSKIIKGAQEIVAGKVNSKNIKYLAQLGIDADQAKAIAKMFDKFGLVEDGLYISKVDKWTDKRAKTAFSAALSKEIDRTIVTPGVGDRPLWMSTETGKMFGQFKSFTFASTQRALISGLQQDKMMFLNNLIISSSLGMLVYYLKTPHERLSDNPEDWVREGIDRSGLLGILTDTNALLEKTTRGSFGVSALTGRPPLTRYASTSAMGLLAGPTMGTALDMLNATGAAASGDWTKQDVRAVRRLLPYQNVPGIEQIFNEFEDGVNQSLGTN